MGHDKYDLGCIEFHEPPENNFRSLRNSFDVVSVFEKHLQKAAWEASIMDRFDVNGIGVVISTLFHCAVAVYSPDLGIRLVFAGPSATNESIAQMVHVARTAS